MWVDGWAVYLHPGGQQAHLPLNVGALCHQTQAQLAWIVETLINAVPLCIQVYDLCIYLHVPSWDDVD